MFVNTTLTIENFDKYPHELGQLQTEHLKMDIQNAMSTTLRHMCIPFSFLYAFCGYLPTARFKYNCHKVYGILNRQDNFQPEFSHTMSIVGDDDFMDYLDDDETETDISSILSQ